MSKIDANPSVCTSKWSRLHASSIWEPDFPPRKVYEAQIIEEQYLRSQAEEERCKNLRSSMEKAINKMFSGEELVKVQDYKEKILDYLKNNLKYNPKFGSEDLEKYIAIYYKHLKKENVTVSEYEFLHSNSIKTDSIENKLRSRYRECESKLEMVLSEIKISKEQIIELINNVNQTDNAQRLSQIIGELYTCLTTKEKNGDSSLNITADDFICSFKTIIYLRKNSHLMGMTHRRMYEVIDGKAKTLIRR